MPRATGKDHSRINLDIWGDDDWLDLTPPAQHLYFVLWTGDVTYCGAGDWHPGKIASRAKGWTAAAVETAAVELSTELFLLVDVDTEEFLLRSWVKHDGLWRIPNMAVSMANARGELASRPLRGVVVHEVKKLVAREPDLSSWKRDAVQNMLTQKAVAPLDLKPFNPAVNPSANPWPNPTLNPNGNPPRNGYGHLGANPPANPGPTPAPTPAPTSYLQEGNLGGVPHQGAEPDPHSPPPPRCPKHIHDEDPPPCGACGDHRRRRERWDAEHDPAAARARRLADRRAEIQACPSCDPNGWLLDDDGAPATPAERCPAHTWETAHA